MRNGKIVRLRRAGAWLAGAAVLGACDAPTDPGSAAVAGGPSMLVTPACGGMGGQWHLEDTITTVQTWTRATGPHRVPERIVVGTGGRLTVAPGAVVCFHANAGLTVRGGRVLARGRDTAQVLFTAHDPAAGWAGMHFSASPGGSSYLTNVRIEHVQVHDVAVHSAHDHPVYIDSAVIRQSGSAVSLMAPGSRISRSRVDTTTNRGGVAVFLGTGARFEQTIVRRAAGTGMEVAGPGVLLLGGRIEGSGGVGLRYLGDAAPSPYFTPIRIVGGAGYPALMTASTLARTYGTPALQDSLLGNARDTLVIHGGMLRRRTLTLGPRLPVLVTSTVEVDSVATFAAQPGARMVFARYAQVLARNGGRVYFRGSAASPVLLTADDPSLRWGGLRLYGTVASTSYLTHTRIEHVSGTAVDAAGAHRVLVDSSVIRMSNRAVVLYSPNSRLAHSRVDTTLSSRDAAVELGSNARFESTLVRAAGSTGVLIWSSSVVVMSCEVRDGFGHGIYLVRPVTIRNCNLVNNAGAGILGVSNSRSTVTGNWWGSTRGPSAADGDGAEGWLLFNPWRTTPHVLPYVP